MREHLPFRLMLGLDPAVRHVSVLSRTTIVPSILQEIGTVPIDVIHRFWVGDRDVIRSDAYVGPKVLVSLVNSKIVTIFEVVSDSPYR